MSEKMGTTVILLTESESRLAGTEQVKHTPGPFHITTERGPDDEFCFHSIRRDDGSTVISTWAPDGEAQSEADAKFFAAAPDMLAALKLARECIAYCRKAHKDAQSGSGFPVEMILDAAIAKAEGRTP